MEKAKNGLEDDALVYAAYTSTDGRDYLYTVSRNKNGSRI
jgi:hypothetical protein